MYFMKINTIYSIGKKLGRERRQSFSQFLLFIFIAFAFWFALTLNEEFKHDIEYPISITNVPDSTTLISSVPKSIKTNITAKGYLFLKYKIKSQTINIDFQKFKRNNSIYLSQSDLNNLLKNTFGINAHINTTSLDSINISYTNRPGKKVSLTINTSLEPNSKYVIAGSIQPSTKSVLLYSINEIPEMITSVETELIKCENLSQTTTIKAKIVTPTGMRAIPDSVDITIPIEPLLSKKRIVSIEAYNVPSNIRLNIFPSQVEVNYLIPKSLFNNEGKYLKAMVDYNDTYLQTNKLPLNLVDIPEYCRSATCTIDSIEYTIEQ